jgi:predicted nucleotidyltransferase
MRFKASTALAEEIREAARDDGKTVSRWVADALDERLRTRQTTFALEPGDTALVPRPDGAPGAAFCHVRVVNRGAFAQRVRGWLKFATLDGRSVGSGEMPVRWSSAPEPVRMLSAPDAGGLKVVYVPDPSLIEIGYVADFASGEEHVLAAAIKFDDGTVWGWTQSSYFHGWRDPKWMLRAEDLVLNVRIRAGAREFTKQFRVPGGAPLADFRISASRTVGGLAEPLGNLVPLDRYLSSANPALRSQEGWRVARVAAGILKERFGVRRVVAFGSLVSGKLRAGSDIDLAVEGLAPERYVEALAQLDGIGPFEVSLLRIEDALPQIRDAATRGVDL